MRPATHAVLPKHTYFDSDESSASDSDLPWFEDGADSASELVKDVMRSSQNRTDHLSVKNSTPCKDVDNSMSSSAMSELEDSEDSVSELVKDVTMCSQNWADRPSVKNSSAMSELEGSEDSASEELVKDVKMCIQKWADESSVKNSTAYEDADISSINAMSEFEDSEGTAPELVKDGGGGGVSEVKDNRMKSIESRYLYLYGDSSCSAISEVEESSSNKSPSVQPNLEADGAEPDSEELTVAAVAPVRTYAIPEESMPEELRTFMKALRRFWTRDYNLERRGPPITESTFAKTRERIMCYLGYSKRYLPTVLDKSVFINKEAIEVYLDYLKVVRHLQASTLSNHVSSILYAVKYIHRDSAPLYRDIPVLAQLRTLATQLQREGNRDRPQTKEELERLGKWLDWTDILKALRLQRDKYELSRGAQAPRELMDVILLGIYTSMPPARALEIRTLQIFHDTQEQLFVQAEHRGQNYLVKRLDGSYYLSFQSFKTKNSRPPDEVDVQKDSIDLPGLLTEYLARQREKLLCGTSSDYLFLNKSGKPFSGGAFTSHMQGLFQRLVGVRISVNCLRAAFITWAYGQRDCNDTLKDSIASALRHSRREADRTYDRRTSKQKREGASNLAHAGLDSVLEGVADSGLDENEPADRRVTVDRAPAGTFVALVEEGSTLSRPAVLLGQIASYPSADVASLLWYKRQSNGSYVLEFNEKQWIESLESLLEVTTLPHKKSGGVRLTTSLREIHRRLALT